MTRSKHDAQGVACLMVTQPGREALLRRSIDCFNRQTLAARQLVLVHTGDSDFEHWLRALPEAASCTDLTVVKARGDMRLGALRNLSVDAARREFLCQWDDDDLHHPEFLARQHACVTENEADFCFLTDQWHFFEKPGFVFWDDWSTQPPPLDLIEGTLFGRRNRMPAYPDLAIGEDTPLVHGIVQRGERIARLSGQGWLKMYSWHGANAWQFRHHLALSQARRLGKEALDERVTSIESALQGYVLDRIQLRFPWDEGWLEFRFSAGNWRYQGIILSDA
jgi:hypothetical protein